jgi:gamma-glutamyltranspeptidase/glutathione hydrolase
MPWYSKLSPIAAALLLAIATLSAHAQTAPSAPAPILTSTARFLPVVAKHGMVASQEKRASRVGVDILKAGGNAVDAAVAIGFALAVTHPQAGNIGGGGFMLVHIADRGQGSLGTSRIWGTDVGIDYRETAPAAMTRDVFLDENGEADPKKSRDSALGIGVPGTVAGLALASSEAFAAGPMIAPGLTTASRSSAPRCLTRWPRWSPTPMTRSWPRWPTPS